MLVQEILTLLFILATGYGWIFALTGIAFDFVNYFVLLLA